MQEQVQEQVKSFSEEKFKALAEKNNWSVSYAQGFIEGEAVRRSAQPAPRVALIGIDQYALGFRAGYFERRTQDTTRQSSVNGTLGIHQLRLQA